MNSEFTVIGMTCGHCVQSVQAEVGQLAGVREVRVDLPTGRLTVDSDGPVPREAIAEAVDEAGYTLADA
jgi:copper ion binding protein